MFRPTRAQVDLLKRGLTFVPTPTSFDKEELRRDLYLYHRRIKILDYFTDDNPSVLPFALPSSWEPAWDQLDGRVKGLIRSDVFCFNLYTPLVGQCQSLHLGDQHTIRTLQTNPNVIIKQADKGFKIVILDRQQYAMEAKRQLNNPAYYKTITGSIQPQTQLKVREVIQKLYHNKFINAKQRDFLFGPNNPRDCPFYLLPKIHKEPHTWTVPYAVPPGRPIVSDRSSVTYNIAMYIDFFLGPLSSRHPSYLKDTYHFLDIIRPIILPDSALLFTLDVDSLYTNIDTDLGLKTVKRIFNRYPDKLRPDAEILQLLEICLRCNDFVFDDEHYLQVQGTAMGHRYAPSYANLYMSEWEREVLDKCPLKPVLYYRFLDDIIGAWTHGEDSFLEFVDTLNNHHPSIQVKHHLDSNHVNFLDTTGFF